MNVGFTVAVCGLTRREAPFAGVSTDRCGKCQHDPFGGEKAGQTGKTACPFLSPCSACVKRSDSHIWIAIELHAGPAEEAEKQPAVSSAGKRGERNKYSILVRLFFLRFLKISHTSRETHPLR